MSVLGFPLCRVFARLMRDCLDSEQLYTLFIGLRLIISVFWSAWVSLPAYSIQTHQSKYQECYNNQRDNHRQNDTGIGGGG